MEAALGDREIHVDRMDQAAVVPKQNIPDAPGMMILIFRLDRMLVESVQQRVAFALRQADDAIRPVGVEVDRLPAGLFVNANQRMHCVLGVGLLLRRELGRRRHGAARVVAVSGAQAIEARLHRFGEVFSRSEAR